MGNLTIFFRFLLSLSVCVAGFVHAMPVQAFRMADAGSVPHAHCEEHAARAMHGVGQAGLHLPSHPASDMHPAATAGCCKAGVCPCPQLAAVLWEGAVAAGSPGHHASDVAPLRSAYRSPTLERLIRPPIV